MSTHYKHNEILPLPVIAGILHELAKAEMTGSSSVLREFVMRIPVEREPHAELVPSEAAEIVEQLAQSKALLADARAYVREVVKENEDRWGNHLLHKQQPAIDCDAAITAFLEGK